MPQNAKQLLDFGRFYLLCFGNRGPRADVRKKIFFYLLVWILRVFGLFFLFLRDSKKLGLRDRSALS